MKTLQTLEGFFHFCQKHCCDVESLHTGAAVFYLAFKFGKQVAQYTEYKNASDNIFCLGE